MLSASQSFWQRRDESVWRNDDDSKTGPTARTRRAPAAIILTCLRPAIRKIGSKITFFRNLLGAPEASEDVGCGSAASARCSAGFAVIIVSPDRFIPSLPEA